jgi:hypothetical protein
MFLHDDSISFPTLKQQNLPAGRVYRVESGEHKGTVYPSITRVLKAKPKPQLEAWKQRVGVAEAARISGNATKQGTSLHGALENYLDNKPLADMPLNVLERWTFLRPWLDQHVTRVFRQECDVFSNRLCVAGRFDALVEIDNILSIMDLKTASRPKKREWVEDYFIQGTFYAFAVYELTGRKVKQIVLPIVHPEGLQVVDAKPLEYMDPLISSINAFYQSYAREAQEADAASAK